MAKDVLFMMKHPESTVDTNFMLLAIGFIAAFITGLIACTWMISLVKKAKLSYFAFYCFLVGIVAISLHFYFQA